MKLGLLASIVVAIGAMTVGLLSMVKVKYHVNKESGLIVVTGSSSGIGHYLCERLAIENPTLDICCTVRKENDRKNLISEFSELSNVHIRILDITSDNQVKEMSIWVDALDKPLVALINNAGRSEATSPIELMDLEEMQSTFEVNVFGTVKLTKSMLPYLRRSRGRVINVGSIVGALPAYAGGFSYTGSKRALESFNDALRQEMAIHGVSVSLLQPGTVKSRIQQNMNSRQREYTDEELKLYPQIFGEKPKEATNRVFSKADPPEVLMPAIRHSLFDPYPQTRYVMANLDGAPVGFIKFLFWLLPDRVSDLVLGA